MLKVTETIRTRKVSVRRTLKQGDKVKTTERARVTRDVVRTTTRGLKFGNGNAKLDKAIFTFSLPAGHFCPFARQCQSRADRHTGKIRDGEHTTFRCYAASEETRPSVRDARWHNAELLLACTSKDEMVRLILDSLSPFAGYVRIHTSGDFYSQEYFDAWAEVARLRPRTTFYAYTKSLPFWVRRLGELPDNLVLTASYGGRFDHLIAEHGLRSARVVLSEDEANALGLEIDHDDRHAAGPGPSFALLVHGMQPAGTPAAKAVAAMRAAGQFGYGRDRKGRLSLAVLN